MDVNREPAIPVKEDKPDTGNKKRGAFFIDGIQGNVNDTDKTLRDISKLSGGKASVKGFRFDPSKPIREQGTWVILPVDFKPLLADSPGMTSEQVELQIATLAAVDDFLTKNPIERAMFIRRFNAAVYRTQNNVKEGTQISILLEAVYSDTRQALYIEANKNKLLKAAVNQVNNKKKTAKANRKAQKQARRRNRR